MQSGGIGLIEGIILLLVVAFIFFIYVGFKSIEFIVTAINLYKKMIKQQTVITALLIDLRDNTKNFDNKSILRDKKGDDSSLEELIEDDVPKSSLWKGWLSARS